MANSGQVTFIGMATKWLVMTCMSELWKFNGNDKRSLWWLLRVVVVWCKGWFVTKCHQGLAGPPCGGKPSRKRYRQGSTEPHWTTEDKKAQGNKKAWSLGSSEVQLCPWIQYDISKGEVAQYCLLKKNFILQWGIGLCHAKKRLFVWWHPQNDSG